VYADTSRINSTLRPWLCRFTYTYAFQPSPSHPRSLSLSLFLSCLLSFPPRRPAVYIRPFSRGAQAHSQWRDKWETSPAECPPEKYPLVRERHLRLRRCLPIVILFLTCSINCCSPFRRPAVPTSLPFARVAHVDCFEMRASSLLIYDLRSDSVVHETSANLFPRYLDRQSSDKDISR